MPGIMKQMLGALVSLALAAFAILVLVVEIQFALQAVPTTAVVESFTARRDKFGRGRGIVVHEVAGQPVKATLGTWFYHQPEIGDRLSVLYHPDEPHRVELNSFLQRYGPVPIPLVLAVIVARWSGLIRLRRNHNTEGAAL